MATRSRLVGLLLLALSGCSSPVEPPDAGLEPSDASMPDASKPGGPSDASAGGPDAAVGCEANRDCPLGTFCQFLAPGDGCAHPRCASPAGGGCQCGLCAAPRATLTACRDDPAEGDPCDEAANQGLVCRRGSCTMECLPECVCVAGRWQCSVTCNDFCGPFFDGGWGCQECGVPPQCKLHCR